MSKRKSVASPEEYKVEPIQLTQGDDLDERVSHHDIDGEVNGYKLGIVIAAMNDGTIQFIGPYHDARRSEAFDHLADHLENLPVDEPAKRDSSARSTGTFSPDDGDRDTDENIAEID